MTSVEFRSDPTLRDYAKALFANPTFQLMVEITEKDRPSRRPVAITADIVGLQLGRTYGYEEALDALRSLTKPIETAAPHLEEDWGAQKEDEVKES